MTQALSLSKAPNCYRVFCFESQIEQQQNLARALVQMNC